MELTKRDLIKIRLLELSGLTDDNIDEKYKELYHKWLFFNSGEVYLNGKLLSESEKRLMAVAGFKSIDGELKFSSTKKIAGGTLTEKDFINNYIERYSLLINEIPYNETLLNVRASAMLEYLENKLKLFTPKNSAPEAVQESEKRYIYGLRGIRQLFNVSHTTAQRYKDTIIKDAVLQQGRRIIVDADKAMELFNNWRA